MMTMGLMIQIMNYRPLPVEATIKQSDIEGMGLYSTCAIESGTNLGMTHYKAPELENGWCRTPLGGFINHSDKPNCVKKMFNNRYFLKTNFLIKF